ncbi:MAG: ribonuclease H-like domain-containing protein [bacterium]
MTELRDRLTRLGVLPESAPEGAAAPDGGFQDAAELLPSAREVSTPHGKCVLLESRWPAGAAHGGERLSDLAGPVGHALATLGGADLAADLDLAGALFLDVESTGLGAGASTYAFLVAYGRLEREGFRIRQLFLRGPEEEHAFVHLLSEAFEGCRLLVTFNGRSFDLPLLHTRFILQKRPLELLPVPHVDLMWPARRIWRHRLPSCALGSLEQHLLGYRRTGDVPGHEIPGLYLAYLQTGDASPLAPVVSHNALDVLSLASVAIRIRRTLAAQPSDAGARVTISHPEDWHGVGCCREAFGDLGGAEEAYRAAAQLRADGAEERTSGAARARSAARRALSRLYKRQRRWTAARDLWKELATAPSADGVYPFEELAKRLEHQDRDYRGALALVESALEQLRAGELQPRRARGRLLSTLEHRRARLRRKVDPGERP